MAKKNSSNRKINNSPWSPGGGFWTSTRATYSNKGFTFDFLEDYFIDMTMKLSEGDIREMLVFLKSRPELTESYASALFNLFMNPKKRLFSEDLIIEFYNDTRRSRSVNSQVDFLKVYGKLLDGMPRLKLLISL
jgi:hypothetical protein